MSKKRQLRFHKDIYYPLWAETSLNSFLDELRKRKTLTFSVHSVVKIIGYSFDYGKQMLKYLLKSINVHSLSAGEVFEFYSFGEKVSKACFRVSFDEFPVDLVLVISTDGTVITVFTTNKHDNHDSLNVELYEKG